ncbi:MAG: N-acetyl-gamma-glutamyl-phosphate reductase [Verrucomicrobia bacterium]|nr:N-acetyl-gamma-glutamyl-phosphate reductase [Verrucomicrobiota bacterium]
MHAAKRKVAVVGASGYAGEELLGILLGHSEVELVCVTSREHAGRPVTEMCPRLATGGEGARSVPAFIAPEAGAVADSGAEFAFLALPHGLAAEFAQPLLERGLRVIDLSADFRLRDPAVYRDFYAHEHPAPTLLGESVYGLPELGPERRARIAAARLVAAPGCYPTSVLMPLTPLLRRGIIDPGQIFITSMSGVTGAGRKAAVELLFAEVDESAKAYGAPRHRHLPEIEQELSLAAGEKVVVSFTPHLLPIRRGILTTIYTLPARDNAATMEPDAVAAAWQEAYGSEPFVRLLPADRLPEIAHVTRTNFIDLASRYDPRTGRWLLFSAEDNLVKGAAGQAVQCFNLMAGLPETNGL